MPSVDQNAARVACPHCGAQYDFPSALAGKRGRCAKCGKSFTVPSAPQSPPKVREEMPAYIGVECHLCGTRFYGGPDQIGKPVKCPDCGARTVLPPPPPPKKKNIPAAMEGDQYELWEPEVQLTPIAMVAHQPKYIAVPCPKCETLMYATEKQIGETIDCPDCGRSYVVPAPKKPKPKRSPISSDIDVPMLDPASAPTERPPALSTETRRLIYEEERESEYGKALEKSRRTGKPMEVDVRGRPILPRWPLLTGVLPFLISPGVPVRWMSMSGGMFLGVSLVLYGMAMAMAGGYGALGGMPIFAAGCVLTMIFLSISFSIFRTIVSESSEGVKEIHNWPNAFDWFGDFLPIPVAAVMCVFPAWLISNLLPREPMFIAGALAIGMVTCFPVAVLSQMDIGSIWGVLSPRVVMSVFRCPFSWLTFWIESGAMAAAWIAGIYAFEQMGINPMFIAAPLGAAILILYARLLGRLGWRLSEVMPESK